MAQSIDSESIVQRLSWEGAFLSALGQLKVVSRAAEAAGISAGSAYARRRRSPGFASAWDEAVAGHGPRKIALRNRAGKPSAVHWKREFLDSLAETSNVTASARRANISPREAYHNRRTDADFAARWRGALYEGYINLEMEVLGYLRDPDPASKMPERKMDVASALRLLAAHKESVAREEAQRANVSAADVRASLARKVEALRQQVLEERKQKQGK